MEPKKEIELDKVHLIALTRLQNHVRNDSLKAFFTRKNNKLKNEYCFLVDEKFGQATLTKWLKKMVFLDQLVF